MRDAEPGAWRLPILGVGGGATLADGALVLYTIYLFIIYQKPENELWGHEICEL